MLVEQKEKILRTIASSIIVLIFSLQASTIVLMAMGKPMGTWYWPFIDYPMYSVAYYEGDYVDAYHILKIVMDDGELREVKGRDIGLNFFKFLYLTRGLKNYTESSSRRSIETLVSLYPDGRRIKEIQVFTSSYIVTRNGMAEAEPKMLNKIEL